MILRVCKYLKTGLVGRLQRVTLTMQHQEQGQIVDIVGQDELLLRMKRFALVLSGDDQLAQMLIERLAILDGNAPRNNISSSAFQFYQLKKLYELWMSDTHKTSEVPRIFRSGNENEAIQKGLDPSIAKIMGGLPSLHRALLLLIYGEKFSYAASAQLLNITIEELMMALAGARRKFFAGDTGVTSTKQKQNTSTNNGMIYDTAQ
jgi:hypothetical protein